jgi:hypothetical protein
MASAVTTYDPNEARRLTDEVKADAAALWVKLLRLYEGGAHTALGYSSWADYCAEEFDMGKSQAYRVLEAARVVEAIPQLGNGAPSEAVARELVPVLREDPEDVEEVWAEVVEEHGPRPTARQVRERVGRATRQVRQVREEVVDGEVVSEHGFHASQQGATVSQRDPGATTRFLKKYTVPDVWRKVRQQIPSQERLECVLADRAARASLLSDLRELVGHLARIEELEAEGATSVVYRVKQGAAR